MARMIDRFLNLDVKLLAAHSLRDHIAGLAPVGIRTTARPCLLGIAAVVFNEPGRRFQKLEMCQCGLSRKRHYGNGEKETNRISHGDPPMLSAKWRHYTSLCLCAFVSLCLCGFVLYLAIISKL